MKTNYHTHTLFCDGANSPEEIILEAIDNGFSEIGISEHAPISFDPESGMEMSKVIEYVDTMAELKEKYKDRISVLCGIERDIFCEDYPGEYDYVIGSVHYAEKNGKHYVLDWKPEMLKEGADAFGGFFELCESYYETVSHVVEVTDCDIIGHFDLVTKFNEKHRFFDESSPRYVAAVMKALDRLVPEDRLFEINTGAISRGHRTTPYPSAFILKELARRGARVILSSDSHRKDTLDCAFDTAYELAKSCGITKIEARLPR